MTGVAQSTGSPYTTFYMSMRIMNNSMRAGPTWKHDHALVLTVLTVGLVLETRYEATHTWRRSHGG